MKLGGFCLYLLGLTDELVAWLETCDTFFGSVVVPFPEGVGCFFVEAMVEEEVFEVFFALFFHLVHGCSVLQGLIVK